MALGQNSVTAVAVATPSATIAGTVYPFAGTTPGSTVSIGAGGAERTLTNLAAGRISNTSTDGINGSQLFATNAAITDVDARVDTLGAGAASNFGGGSTYNAATGALSPPTYPVNGSNYNDVGSALNAIVNGGGGLKYFHANSTLADSTATGTNSVAIGPVANASGIGALASGYQSAATANDALALGSGASAAQVGAVALGSGSVTAAAVGTANTTINGVVYPFAGTAPSSTVSVGAAAAERTITNVAAGRVSDSSTDAINGSQLFATNQAVTAVDGRVDTLGANTATSLGGGSTYDPATGALAAPTYAVNGSSFNNVGDALNAITNGGGGIKYFRANSTLADASAGGTNSVAVGPVAVASGVNAMALGNGATAAQDGAIALGSGSVSAVAVGTLNGTIAGATYTFAGATPASTLSIGAAGAERTITNVAAGRLNASSTDAINGSQLFFTNQAVTDLDTRADAQGTTTAANFGGGSVYNPGNGQVSAPSYTVNGTPYNNVGDALSAITSAGGGIKYFHANSTLADSSATGGNSIAVGPLAAASGAGTIALGNNAASTVQNSIALGSNTLATQANAMALGNQAQATGGNAIALGAEANASQVSAMALGASAEASAQNAMAIGQDSAASGVEAVAVGFRAIASGGDAFVLGNQATVEADNGVAIGSQSTDTVVIDAASAGAVSIGSNAKIATSTNAVLVGAGSSITEGNNGIAVGSGTKVSAAGATALGSGATAGNADAVALGSNSVTAAAVATAGATIAGTPYTYAGTTPASTVSVGAVGAERTITNVAAGRVSGTSTDAINGSQLFATDQAVDSLDGRVDTLGGNVASNLGGGSAYDPATGAVSAPAYNINGSPYNNVGDALNAISNGGGGIKYFRANSVLGDAVAGGANSVAAGPLTNAAGASSVAVGNDADAFSSDSVAIGRAAVAGILGGTSGETAVGTTASATANQATAVGFGSQATAVGALALGSGANAAQDAAVALGSGSVTAAAVGTASGVIAGTPYTYAGTTPASTVSVGAASAERTITNVAAGRVTNASTDAINGSQLAATNQAVTDLDTRADTQGTTTAANFGGGSTYDQTTGAVSAPAYNVGGTTYNNVGDAITNLATGGAVSKYFHANSVLGDSNPSGIDSIAVGPVATATGVSAVAIGLNALAGEADAVALGSNSVTAAAVGTASGTIAGTTYTYAGATPGSTLSIGAGNAERTLTNLAAGRVSNSSTDAINGSQLFATNQAVDSLDGRVDTLGGNVATNLGGGSTYDPATGGVSAPVYNVGGNTYNNVGDAISVLATGGASSKYFRANSILADSVATGTDSIAVGPVANSTATDTIAIGRNAMAGNGTAGIGATALGTQASASGANSLALGQAAASAQDNAVALGSGSVTAVAVGTASGVIAGTTYPFAGAAPTSTVSVGAAGAERTITNVAAGRLSNASTDSINGSQLFATNQAVDSLDGRVDTLGGNVATNLGGGSAYDPATGAVSAPTYTVNGSPYSNVGDAITAITTGGGGIKYFRANSTLADASAGGTNSVAAGPLTNAAGVSSVAMGLDADAFSSDSVAIGRAAVAGVPGGTSGETAVGTTAAATANQSSAFGFGSQATAVGALAAGATAAASGLNATALGNGAVAAQDAAVALGTGSVTAAAVGTANGVIAGTTYTFAGTTPASTVSVGAANAERTLTNVAAGRVSNSSTDAINGSQLFATNTAVTDLDTRTDAMGNSTASNLGGGSNYDPATGIVSAPAYQVGGVTYNNVGDAISHLTAGGGIKYFHANSTLADSTTSGTDSVAVGPVANASATAAVAIGLNTIADQAGSVALGSGSVTGPAVPTPSGVIAGTTYNYAGAAPASTVSVGAPSAERTLTNLAAGRVSQDSTDAVNGSQLFATNTAVDSLDGRVDTLGGNVATNLGGGSTYDPATGAVTAPTYNVGGNTYNNVGGAVTNLDNRVTNNSTAITNLSTQLGNGTIGLVQQDPGSRDITVAQATDGTRINVAGTAGDRVLAGVADGTISSTSSEAVNGSQLYETNQNVLNLSDTVGIINNGGGIKYFHANSTAPDSAASGIESVAIGPSASATMTDAVAIGDGAIAQHVNSVALGAGSQTITGAQPNYQGAYVGASDSTGEVNIGGRTISGVAAGAIGNDAVNVSQLQAGVASANAYTDNRISQVGGGSLFQVNARLRQAPVTAGDNSVAGGSSARAIGNNSIAIGNTTQATADSAVALGNGAHAMTEGSVAIGANSIADRANTLSVGSRGSERAIANVAAGSDDTDAVNVSQLRAAQAGNIHYDNNADGTANPESLTLNPGGSPTTVHNVGAGVMPTDAVNLGQLQHAVGDIRSDMWDERRESRGGTASAMAMAGMPQAQGAGRHMMAVGVGGYEGEVGMAVGMSGVSDNGRYLYKAQVTGNTTSDFGFAVGAGFQW